MQTEDPITVIKPEKPWEFLGMAIFFSFLAFMLFTSDYFDFLMGIGASFLFMFSLLFFWMTDRCYMEIIFYENSIKLTGYFSIRELSYENKDIEGYQIKEIVDQYNGLHGQIRIKTTKGKLIVIPKLAYNDYQKLNELISERYDYLNFEPLKYAEFYKKTLPLIALISGLLYLTRVLYDILK